MRFRLLRNTRLQRRLHPGGLLLCALLLPAGCKLVDQETFAPAPEARPAAAARPASAAAGSVAPALAGSRRALVIIDYTTAAPSYRELLRYAVQAAEARDRAVEFDVVAVLPNIDQANRGQHDATEVMRAIMANGVPESRIHLGLSTDPGLSARQVRVYVR